MNSTYPIDSQDEREEGRAPKKKKMLVIAICISTAIIVAACAYVGIAASYESRFLPNTYIQTANVSDMDVSNAGNTVIKTFDDSKVTIVEDGHDDIVLTGSELGVKPVAGSIDELLSKQDRWSWIARALGQREELSVGVQYDSQLLIAKVNELDCVNPEKRTAPKDASIEYIDELGQFEAIEGEGGNLVDKDALLAEISHMIVNGGGEIHVSDYYAKPDYAVDSSEVLEAVSEANRIISKNISYNIDMIDNAETLTKEQIASFLTVGDDMSIAVDEEAVRAWLRETGQEYDTVGEEIRYTTAYGKEAVLPTGVIGWETDEAAMLPIVVENLMGEEQDIDQDFTYEKEGLWAKGGTPDFGDKYIDLDITEQTIRLVENGQIINEFETVTGTDNDARRTDVGAWRIYFMATDYLMVSEEIDANGRPSYETPAAFAAFWHSGEGAHDAEWRSAWGSNVWKYSGSHGCANMHMRDIKVLYDFAEMDMPVLVHM